MATHSSIFAWNIPWSERLAGYSPWGHKELVTKSCLATKQQRHSMSHGLHLKEHKQV